MKVAKLFILALALGHLSLSVTFAKESSPQPNVVLIISDDQSWTDYTFMGHPNVQTPRLDQLADESLTFPRGYVPASLCCPSLASIITGLYPHQHKITSNDPPVPKGMPRRKFRGSDAFKEGRELMIQFMEAVPTLPRLLADKGYLSLQTGKWWQGHYSHGGFTHGMTQGSRHGDEGLKIGRESMEPIYDFIEMSQEKEQPFFVWYAPFLPHRPHNPPERLLNKYKDKTSSIHIARYWAMIEWFDETCGQLLDYLDDRQLSQNTIVIYLADNGWIQKDNSSGYAPRSKRSPYDGGLRTPLMIRWPGKVKPRTTQALASSIDIVPTVLSALAIEPTDRMQGIDLLDRQSVQQRDTIYGEGFTHNAVDLHEPASSLRFRWLIENHWKLIVPSPNNEPDEAVQLYNLAEDPHEKNNLAPAKPELVQRLKTKVDQRWKP